MYACPTTDANLSMHTMALPIIGNNIIYNMARFALVGHTYVMCSFLFSIKQLQFILATAFVVVCLFGGFAYASGSTACIETIRAFIDTLDKIEADFKGTHHIVFTQYNGDEVRRDIEGPVSQNQQYIKEFVLLQDLRFLQCI